MVEFPQKAPLIMQKNTSVRVAIALLVFLPLLYFTYQQSSKIKAGANQKNLFSQEATAAPSSDFFDQPVTNIQDVGDCELREGLTKLRFHLDHYTENPLQPTNKTGFMEIYHAARQLEILWRVHGVKYREQYAMLTYPVVLTNRNDALRKMSWVTNAQLQDNDWTNAYSRLLHLPNNLAKPSK